ncbi:hypothetical protein K435DRAFT_974567 [Dendrothele bispora CBS 962.96]|uniref:F-box domain-containing protein n=1 Tax=Dendrothele bispora (strain CBS 962.96) TaxID=1314807 RepID=A0A4S8KKU1_DENBC|nr:hypothetical protein K435DRAFT_974567 [Dendrothele bispora CBS 962.96]
MELPQRTTSLNLLGVPAEVFDTILGFVTVADQVSLCHVCKLLFRPTARRLYRRIQLNTPSQVVMCCRTLASNEALASFVRELTLNPLRDASSGRQYLLYGYYSLISRAFRNLHNLQELNLAGIRHERSHGFVLFQHTFPDLKHLSVDLPLDNSRFASFLERNHSLISLNLASLWSPWGEELEEVREEVKAKKEFLRTMKPISLPRLSSLTGSAAYVPLLARNASLSTSIIVWDVSGTDEEQAEQVEGEGIGRSAGTPFDEVFEVLETSSKETMRAVAFKRRGWNLDLLDGLAKVAFPNLSVVFVNNLRMPHEDAFPGSEVVKSIADTLSRFRDLVEFRYDVSGPHLCLRTKSGIDTSLQAVISWGNACPTLRKCTAPNQVHWKRLSNMEDVWVPEDDVDPFVIDWMLERLQHKEYPGWEKILVVLEDHIVVASMMQSSDTKSFQTEMCSLSKEEYRAVIESEKKVLLEVDRNLSNDDEDPFDIPRFLDIIKRYRDCDCQDDDSSQMGRTAQEVLVLGILFSLWQYDFVLALGKKFDDAFASPRALALSFLMYG